MTDWNELTYDQQRALLGLPDVTREVGWIRLRAAFFGVHRAIDTIRAAADLVTVQVDYALAKGK